VWPTDACTPARLTSLTARYGNLWGGAHFYRKYRNGYRKHTSRVEVDGSLTTSPSAEVLGASRAPNGSKLFVGTRNFWRLVAHLFMQTDVSLSVDNHF